MIASPHCQRILTALTRSGLSQGKFAEIAGVSASALSQILRGSDPRLGTWAKIEAALVTLEKAGDRR